MDFIYHLVHKFAIMKNNKNNIMRTNMKILISFLVLLLFIECTSSNENDINSNLAILDSTQEHPEKWIDLQEIADVEYIPLETTDDSGCLGINWKQLLIYIGIALLLLIAGVPLCIYLGPYIMKALWLIIKYVAIGLWYLIKYLFIGLWYLITSPYRLIKYIKERGE